MASFNASAEELPKDLSACLFVGDLLPDVTEHLLMKTFIMFGPICSVRVFRNTVTGRSLGHGYVNFTHFLDAERAMNSFMFDDVLGKPMRVMWYQPDSTLRRSGIGNICIRGLAKDIESNALYETFSVFGEILSCKVACDKFGPKGYGFVHFKSFEAAEKAIKTLDGMLLNDQKVSICHYKSYAERQAERMSKKPERSSYAESLYVQNLPYNLNSKQLARLFYPFGNVTSATLMMENGRSKGFGFITFSTPEATARALAEMNGRFVGNRRLSVALSRSAEKRQETKEEVGRAEITHSVLQPASAVPLGNFMKTQTSCGPAQLSSWLQPSTLQDAKSIVPQGQNLQRVISATHVDAVGIVNYKVPALPFIHSAFCPGNFVETVPPTNQPNCAGVCHRPSTRSPAMRVLPQGHNLKVIFSAVLVNTKIHHMTVQQPSSPKQMTQPQTCAPQTIGSVDGGISVQLNIPANVLGRIQTALPHTDTAQNIVSVYYIDCMQVIVSSIAQLAATRSSHTSQQNAMSVYSRDSVQITIYPDVLDTIQSIIEQIAVMFPSNAKEHAQNQTSTVQHAVNLYRGRNSVQVTIPADVLNTITSAMTVLSSRCSSRLSQRPNKESIQLKISSSVLDTIRTVIFQMRMLHSCSHQQLQHLQRSTAFNSTQAAVFQMPALPVNQPALPPWNFGRNIRPTQANQHMRLPPTTQLDAVGLFHPGEVVTIITLQHTLTSDVPRVLHTSQHALSPCITNRRQTPQNMASLYSPRRSKAKNSISQQAGDSNQQSSLWGTVKKNLTSVVCSPLTWTVIGLWVLTRIKR